VSTSSSEPPGVDQPEDAIPVVAGSAPDDVSDEDKARAGAALRASFARLSPQGSDEWNFMGAFTHLGDRYGPYQPGTSELADLVRASSKGALATRRGRRGRPSAGESAAPDGEKSDVEDAMTHVVEAFRFLHARVSTLEQRLGTEDVPLDGAAWLAPARELGGWVEPIAAIVLAQTPGGEIVHADGGEGALVRALSDRGVPARGVEPRGGVALRALESGCDVTISEVGELLAQRPAGSLGGLVLSGVVDRLPLHAILPLLADARRVLAPGAPIVIVSEPVASAPAPAHKREPVTEDTVDGADLHAETWVLLLTRSGFVDVAPLPPAAGGDDRFGLSAAVPTT
jgi:hypothetical protein